MAVQLATLQPSQDIHHIRYTWAPMVNGDTGAPVRTSGSVNIMVRNTGGTFGAGGTITWQGSTDGGATWFTLSDTAVGAITQTAIGQKMVLEIPFLVRPNVTAGDGTTSLATEVVLQFLPGA